MTWTAPNHLGAFGAGSPSGVNLPAAIKIGMSPSEKPNSFAVVATSRRAGKPLAAQVVMAVCIKSSVINQSISSGHRYSTSYPVRPATRPALRAGQVVRPCRVPSISHQPQSFGVLSADHGGFSRLVPTRQHPCYQGQANARCLMPAQPRQFYPKCYRQREPPG